MFFQQSYVSSRSVNLPHTPSHSLTSLEMIKVHPSLLLLVSRLTEMCAFAHGSGNLCDAAFIPLASQRLLSSAFIIKANNDVINHTRPGMRLWMATIWYLERFKLGQVCLHMLCKLTSMRWCSHLCCGLFWCLFFYFFYLSLTLYLWKMSPLLGAFICQAVSKLHGPTMLIVSWAEWVIGRQSDLQRQRQTSPALASWPPLSARCTLEWATTLDLARGTSNRAPGWTVTWLKSEKRQFLRRRN